MKSMILAASFFLSAAASASCVDFSGEYWTGRTVLNRQFILTIAQKNCEAIALGNYIINDGVIEDVVNPLNFYLSENTSEPCEVSRCPVYQNKPTGVLILVKSQAPVSPNCDFDRIEWSLYENGDIKQTFFVNDSRIVCQGIVTLEKRLLRFHP